MLAGTSDRRVQVHRSSRVAKERVRNDKSVRVKQQIVKCRVVRRMAPSSSRRHLAAPPDAIASRGVVVRRPRDRDGIGAALRESFDGVAQLPDEFRGYLRALDRVGSRH
ncbi:hypothetical protein ACBY01_12010 [Sphingomonas sp. ac-8]|uniref:hypothetical protein n=1 Tax=Sphingomonas sp. ac-8 TaxID=3242977 RepID=UPI003A80CE53